MVEKIKKLMQENLQQSTDTDNIGIGAKILIRLDHLLTDKDSTLQQSKKAVAAIGDELVSYIYDSLGSQQSADTFMLLRHSLFDRNNWKRLGLEAGGNRGRTSVNPTLTKYLTMIYSYLLPKASNGSNKKLTAKTNFAEIRQAYSERGNGKIIANEVRQVSKLVLNCLNNKNLTKADILRISKKIRQEVAKSIHMQTTKDLS